MPAILLCLSFRLFYLGLPKAFTKLPAPPIHGNYSTLLDYEIISKPLRFLIKRDCH